MHHSELFLISELQKVLFQRQPTLEGQPLSSTASHAPQISFLLNFSVIPSHLWKAPASGEQLGILFLINADCHECSTVLVLSTSVSIFSINRIWPNLQQKLGNSLM